MFGEFTLILSCIWWEKFSKYIDQPKGCLLVVNTNLDGFNLVNLKAVTLMLPILHLCFVA